MKRAWLVVLASVLWPLAPIGCNGNRAGPPDDASSPPALESPQEGDVKGVDAKLE